MRCSTFLLAAALSAPVAVPAHAQDFSSGYRDFRALEGFLNRLERDYDDLVRVIEIAISPGGRAVHAVTLGMGDDIGDRPALLIIANAFGPHVVGSEIAANALFRLAELYGSDSLVTDLLNTNTIYVIPRANPDAAEAFFQPTLAERIRNEGSGDDDHDWRFDEDPPNDLNGDGLITMMRVRDPAGEWVADSANPDLMRKADRDAGESGLFRLMVEGVDDDGDGVWNEDPPGEVNVNANFSYDYDYFGPATGLHQMSSPEARGIAEFFVGHPNIAAVYVLGPQDNLWEPWEHKSARGIGGNPQGTSGGGPYTTILADDEPFFAQMAERFEELSAQEDGPPAADLGGDPLSWAYFHMGRWAFGSRAWWIPEVAADSGESREGEVEGLARDYNAHRWLTANVPGGFVPWVEVDHPDFPDREVEVGGFAPFVRLNPPGAMLDSITAEHVEFVRELAGALPRIEFRRLDVDEIGTRTYRIELELANNGYLPTLSAIGVRAFWPRRIRLSLETDGQEVIGGRSVQLLGPIPGSGGFVEASWVVVGRPGSRVTISAASPVAGTITQSVTLR